VSNSSQNEERVTCVFRVDEDRIPEIWDAETGLIQREIEYSRAENGISIELVMDPLASRFVVFRNKSTGKNDAGLNYNLQYGFHQIRKEGEVKKIDISDNWDLSFNHEMGGPESYKLEKLTSWEEIDHEGIKYYSGSVSYSREFSVTAETLSKDIEAFVAFEDIQEMARVFVNGNDCGIVWLPPYKTNITRHLKAGTNNITVQVVNTWNNRIVGDLRNPDKKPFTNTNAKARFSENSSLLKSGLTGTAEIFIMNRYE